MAEKNIDVYKKRQRILLVSIASGLVIIILALCLIAFLRDIEFIGNSQPQTQAAVPADAQDQSGTDNNIGFEESEIIIKVGEKYTPVLLGIKSPQDVSGWESTNSAVAVVNESGEITGVSEGSCSITVKISNTDSLLEIKVTVTAAEESTEHEVIEDNGVTYIDGILMASKTYSMPADFDPGANEDALAAFDEMQTEAAAEGLNIYISSGYRSYYDQERIYNNYVERDGQEAADTYSSRPGYSDHQTGLAFDLNSIDDSFGLTAESDWVAANAHKYGFIIRYPEGKADITGYQYEPWHIRYIGVEKATEVYESGLCLEEFLGVDSEYKD